MVILNRVLLAVMFALIALASLVGALLAFGTITSDQINSIIPFRQLVGFFQANPITSSLVLILAFVVVLVLSAFWLRAQYARALTSVVGGQYELEIKGPGLTTVDYSVVGRAIDYEIRNTPGVVDSQTRIYTERGGQLLAQSSLMIRRDANIHEVDNRIRSSINREWLDKMGIGFAYHDVFINLEPVERRVA